MRHAALATIAEIKYLYIYIYIYIFFFKFNIFFKFDFSFHGLLCFKLFFIVLVLVNNSIAYSVHTCIMKGKEIIRKGYYLQASSIHTKTGIHTARFINNLCYINVILQYHSIN